MQNQKDNSDDFQSKWELGNSPKTKETSWKPLVTSLIASSIANTLGCFAGHPLDTMTIRMQLETRKIGIGKVAYEALVHEGPTSFFKGAYARLLGAIPVVMMVYTIKDQT